MKHAVPMITTLTVAFAMSTVAQTIEIDDIPALGKGGNAKGRVVWSGLSAANASRYAVIAMLDATWGDQYVKPYNNNYLNSVSAGGVFTINITTGGAGDYTINSVLFYLVERSTFAGIDGGAVKKGYMEGRYLAMLSVSRTAFWAAKNIVPEPTASVSPGFVPAGTSVALSCAAGDTIRYTLDGSFPDPAKSPAYTSAFVVPSTGCLIIHAIAVRANKAVSPPVSFTYLPCKPLDKPFFGLNVSLILGDENPGGALSEADTRTRLQPLAPLTHWLRTFGTLNNGHEHINRIAKSELGLRTLIGVWVSSGTAANAAQLNGLRSILQKGPAPDLIAVGNECSLIGVSEDVLVQTVASVRGILRDRGLGASVPVGSVDIGGANWPDAVLRQLDFVGVNLYCGTWDATPQSAMAAATAHFYTNETQRLGKRMVLLTEVGTPYDGGTYGVDGGSQTPSQSKASAYLDAMLDWTHDDRIPLFYFSAYDEAWKSRGTGHPIEQYFGLLGVGGALHMFYVPAVATHQPPPRANAYLSDPDSTEAAPVAITTAYEGFAYDAGHTVRGTVTLNAKATMKANKKDGTATTNWTFSAKAVLQSATLSFSGTAEGAVGRLVLAKSETLDVQVEGNRFHGTLSGGKVGGTLTVDGARLTFADKKDAAAQQRLNRVLGLYNVAMLDSATNTQGYVTLTVGSLGAVKLAGKLSDGTAVSGSAKLLEGLNESGWHCIAFYSPLYSKKGFIGGLLWLNPDDKLIRVDTERGWCVDWQDPKNPPAYALDVLGGYFGNGKDAVMPTMPLTFNVCVPPGLPPPVNPPLDGGTWMNEAFPIGLTVYRDGQKLFLKQEPAPKKVGTAYDYSGINPSCATLTYTAKTGLFKGAFKLYYDGDDPKKGTLQHKTVSVPYSGVMLPNGNRLIGLGTGTATINKDKKPISVHME